MAKVIKKGKTKDPEKWRLKVECKITSPETQPEQNYGNYGAVIEVNKDDLYKGYWEGYFFGHHSAVVKCPKCEKLIDISNEQCPDNVWKLIPKNKIIDTGYRERNS